MDYQTELGVRDIMVKNFNDTNISFPAVVVGIENIKDGLVDVKPIVNYMNSYSRETYEYPVLYNVPLVFPNTGNSSICFPDCHDGVHPDLPAGLCKKNAGERTTGFHQVPGRGPG